MKFIKYTFVFALIIVWSSCTDRFESINSGKYGLSDTGLEQDFNNIKGPLGAVQFSIYKVDPVWQTQLQQNLIGDIYSGYMMTPTPFVSNLNNTTYRLVDGWNGFPWSIAYQDVMSNILKIERRAKTQVPAYYGWALILKVLAMHKVTDIYGPIVYSNFGTEDSLIAYDSQEEVYKHFFNDLDDAVRIIIEEMAKELTNKFASIDQTAYAGNYVKWIKFANSLRLRLAMRIVKVDPVLAKKEAEKATAQPQGVFSATDDIAVLNTGSFKHPLFTMSNAWNDIRMNAVMESHLEGYKDPRLPVFFNTATQEDDNPDKNIKGQYKGIRQGIVLTAKSEYQGFSALGKLVNTNQIVWMTVSEVYFLKAEGALRGWNMGGESAKQNYENGIKASFTQFGVSGADTYISDNASTPIPYLDPNNPVNNIPAGNAALSTAKIAWSDAATNEQKLEQIITQKWIAIFPDGQEAWSEFRRTGYPKLYPVLENRSGGTIDSNIFIRRINFPANEKNSNPEGLKTGITKLGGDDNGGTRIWWDTTGSNF